MSVYIDHGILTKDLKKEKFNDKYLNFVKGEYYNGFNKYIYTHEHEKKQMKVYYIPECNRITIDINIPYFLYGHNYHISLKSERDVIEYLSCVLNVDVFKAEVVSFEAGKVFENPFDFKKIKNSHVKIQGMKTMEHDYSKYFIDKNTQFKLYDFQRNIKTKVEEEDKIAMQKYFGYSPDTQYIKIETKYKRPQITLKKRVLLCDELLTENFFQILKADLMQRYNSIKKLGGVQISNKKQLSSATIPIIALRILEEEYGFNTETFLKSIVNNYNGILTADDRKKRMQQLRTNIQKIQTTNSPYDLSEIMLAQLSESNFCQ